MPYISKKSLAELPRAEYVYLLQDVELTGLYKIGRTNRPKGRVDDFGVKLPFKVEVLRMIPTYNAAKLEAELHEKYEHRRANGEWFDLQENEVLEILCMASTLTPPPPPPEQKKPVQLFKTEYTQGWHGKLDMYEICSLSSGHRVNVMIKGKQTSIEWSNSLNSIIYRKRYGETLQKLPDTAMGAYEMAMMLLEAVNVVQRFK
jgi:hypothetical protein